MDDRPLTADCELKLSRAIGLGIYPYFSVVY